jgi:hypothetical protein
LNKGIEIIPGQVVEGNKHLGHASDMTIIFASFDVPVSDTIHNEVHVTYGVSPSGATEISNMQGTLFRQFDVLNSFDH